MGYIEAWGLGINMMNQEMLKVGLPKPLYAEKGNSFVVTLTGPGDEWMGEEEIRLPDGLNERQRKAVEYVKEHGEINVKIYSEMFNIDRTTAYRDLTDLMAKEIVYKEGKARATKYLLK